MSCAYAGEGAVWRRGLSLFIVAPAGHLVGCIQRTEVGGATGNCFEAIRRVFGRFHGFAPAVERTGMVDAARGFERRCEGNKSFLSESAIF